MNRNDPTLLYYKGILDLSLIGESLRLISEFKESIECFDKALLVDPNNLNVLIGKGNIKNLSHY